MPRCARAAAVICFVTASAVSPSWAGLKVCPVRALGTVVAFRAIAMAILIHFARQNRQLLTFCRADCTAVFPRRAWRGRRILCSRAMFGSGTGGAKVTISAPPRAQVVRLPRCAPASSRALLVRGRCHRRQRICGAEVASRTWPATRFAQMATSASIVSRFASMWHTYIRTWIRAVVSGCTGRALGASKLAGKSACWAWYTCFHTLIGAVSSMGAKWTARSCKMGSVTARRAQFTRIRAHSPRTVCTFRTRNPPPCSWFSNLTR